MRTHRGRLASGPSRKQGTQIRPRARYHGTTGCKAKEKKSLMGKLAEVLRDLFQAHGVEANLGEQWVDFPNRGMRVGASILQEIKQPTSFTVELEVRFEFAPGRTIVEAFAGLGDTKDSAVVDALENFVANSFHVLLVAFFRTQESQRDAEPSVEELVSQEEWLLGGQKRRVTVGNLGVRGKPPVQGAQLVASLEEFKQRLKQQPFGPQTHWVRLYYAQRQGKRVAFEVLLDNQAWEVMEAKMAAYTWPSGGDFYSMRVFLVIDGEDRRGLPSGLPAARHAPKEAAPGVGPKPPFWQFWKR